MSDDSEPWHDKATLRRLYEDEEMTTYEIADEMGVCSSTVRYWMDKHGIERRNTASHYDSEPWRDKATLRRLYEDEGMSTWEIADKMDVAPTTIQYWMDKHGIDRREPKNNTEYSDEELLERIDAFVEEFGVVPAQSDATGWPGPSPGSYKYRFGSWTNAIKAAGHTPRGDQHE